MPTSSAACKKVLGEKKNNVSSISSRKENKKEVKTEIPKQFLKKIKKLGLKEEDAKTLYDTKIDWDVVYSDNKIYCVERGCDFVTELDGGNLTEHMINVHKYGEFPCPDKYCDYVGFSKVSVDTRLTIL